MLGSWERALQPRQATPSETYGGFDAVAAARARRARDVRQENEQRRLQVRQTELDRQSQERLRSSSFDTDLFAGSGTGRDYRQQPITEQERAQRRASLGQFAFGPERSSWVPGVDDASRTERLLRDWGASEQEFRLSGAAAGENRFGAAAGWAALGAAGAVPGFGWLGRAGGWGGGPATTAARASRPLNSPVSGYVPARGRDITSESPRPTPRDPGLGFDTTPETRAYAHEIFNRQGFSALPQAVDETVAATLRGNPEYIQIYRGITPDFGGFGSARTTPTPADALARTLNEGDFYTMYGVHGTGSYWGDATTAAGYAGSGFHRAGVMVEAFLPRNANILRENTRGWAQIKESMRATGQHDLAAYAAAAGYDAVESAGIFTVVNRSALIVNRNAIDVSSFGTTRPQWSQASPNPRAEQIQALRTSGQLQTVDIGGSPYTRPAPSSQTTAGSFPGTDPWNAPFASGRPAPPAGPSGTLTPRPRPRPTGPSGPFSTPANPDPFGTPRPRPRPRPTGASGPYSTPAAPSPSGTPRPRPYVSGWDDLPPPTTTPRPRPRPQTPNPFDDPWK